MPFERIGAQMELKPSRTGVLAKPRTWFANIRDTSARQASATSLHHEFRVDMWYERSVARHEEALHTYRDSGRPLAHFFSHFMHFGHTLSEEAREIPAPWYTLAGFAKGRVKGAVHAARHGKPDKTMLVRPKTLLDLGLVDNEQDAVAVWSMLLQNTAINFGGDVNPDVELWPKKNFARNLLTLTEIGDRVGEERIHGIVDLLHRKLAMPQRNLSLEARAPKARLEYLYDKGLVSSRSESEQLTNLLQAAGVLTRDFLPAKAHRFTRQLEQILEQGHRSIRVSSGTDLTKVKHAFFPAPSYLDHLSDPLMGQAPVAPRQEDMLEEVLDAGRNVPMPVPTDDPPPYTNPPAYRPKDPTSED